MTSTAGTPEELATCARILAMQGLFGVHGHVSVYDARDKTVLITPGSGSAKARLTPDDLVRADLEGNRLEGRIGPPREWPIHMALHASRPDALAVAHLHPPYATLFGIAKRPYRPISLHSFIFASGIPLYPSAHLITSAERGAQLAKTLEGKRAAFMRAHGVTVLARSLKELLYTTLALEDDAKKTLEACTLGDIDALSAPECDLLGRESTLEALAERTWTYFSQLESNWDRRAGTGKSELFV